MHQFNPS